VPTRKKNSKEFKLDAVSLSTEQNHTRAEAARSLGLHGNMLSRWAKEFQSKDGQAFRGNGQLTASQEKNRKLKKQVKRGAMEKDILKITTVFFPAETK
jgi:transposase